MSIMDFWPIESPPREGQIQALEWLEKQTARYLLIQAPVGVGKSLIGYTYSRFIDNSLGNSFILTPQKILQEQYNDAFGEIGLSTLYGKANYTCENRNTNCEIGSVMKKKCPNCPHLKAKTAAVSSPNTSLNYKLALLYMAMDSDQSGFNERKLMVFDEAHVLEQQLVDFDTIAIAKKQCDVLNIAFPSTWTDIANAQEWIEVKYEPALKTVVDDGRLQAEQLQNEFSLTPDEERFLAEWNKLNDHLGEITWLRLQDPEELEDNRVLVHDFQSVSFKALTAVKAFTDVLRGKSERMLFMSATIIDHVGFCRDLGIDPSEAAFLDLSTDFPIDNRPVFYMPQMKMNAAWVKPENKSNREQMKQFVQQILDTHADESGIIHTASFKLAEWYVEFLSRCDIPHHIMHHNPGSDLKREDVINAYQERAEQNKPSILISPSITEGLDLHDDRARFAIFAKIPYGFLGDQWIKRRMQLSSAWYQRQALVQVIQGCGRIVRSNTDNGNVYIIDGSWNYLFNNVSHTIPQWWKDAYTAY